MPLSKAQIREAFDLFDSDSSNEITSEELTIVFNGLGIKFDAEELMAKADANKDGKLNFQEFEDMMHKQQDEAEGPREILAAFQAFNPTGTGEISKEDLKEVAGHISEKVTEQDIQEIWTYCADNDVDKMGNPRFTFKAWCRVMDHVYDPRTTRSKVTEESMTKTLPPKEDQIWKLLEDEEERTREKRILERARGEEEASCRREKTVAVKILATSAYTEDNLVSRETARRRELRAQQDEVKEKMATRKKLLVAQQAAEAEKQKADEEEMERVVARLQGKAEEHKKREEAAAAELAAAEEIAPPVTL